MRDFAQMLKDIERERDESLAKVGVLQRQLGNMETDRNDCEERIQMLQKTLEDTEEGMVAPLFFFVFVSRVVCSIL